MLEAQRPDQALRRRGGARPSRPRRRSERNPRPDRPERLRQDHVLQRHHRHLSRRRRQRHLRRRRRHQCDRTGGLSGRHGAHVPALAAVAAAVDLRQHHDRQPQAAQPGPVVQPDQARRLQARVRGKLRGGARAGRGVRAAARRPHVRAGRRPADDRSPPHRDLPRADQRSPSCCCSTSLRPA